ncbi:hypothetical protein [Erwinia sp. E_sp_B01_9]|uniref:hypothetical protein n=1 Tax=Erwinia sp. E_sp_B01_9 TaxID=3039403 RepID=UPI003D9B83C4
MGSRVSGCVGWRFVLTDRVLFSINPNITFWIARICRCGAGETPCRPKPRSQPDGRRS